MSEISPGVFHAICQTAINGNILKNCEANRRLLAGWIQEDQMEVPSVAWFQKLLNESPRYEEQLVWESADRLDPAKRRQQAEQGIAESRNIFSEAARHFRTFSECEANFQHCCSALGKSFSKVQFQQAYSFGSLAGLVPASAEELEQWKQEQIKAENKFVRDATSPYELSQAKQIVQNRRLENQRTTAQERLEQSIVELYIRECVDGPKETPLPSMWLGQKLDGSFIKKASVETLRALTRRFGSGQLTARLHGLNKVTGVVDRGKGPVELSYDFA